MKIIIADDHRLLRETLVETFESLASGVEVLQASTLSEVDDILSAVGSVDLIVLDLMMPGMNGMAGLRGTCSRNPETPVIVLSGKIDRGTILETLKHGAKGFIPKTIGRSAMINALRLVLSGDTYVPTLALEREGSSPADTDQSRDYGQWNKTTFFSDLTPREWDVLRVLVKGHPNKLIARELGLEEVTVKSHLSNVFRKLGVTNRAQAVAKTLEMGWEGED